MNPKEFGQRVYRLRQAKGWTQEICSARAGISVRTLQMIESYRVEPTIETVRKLAEAFCCSWDDILGKLKPWKPNRKTQPHSSASTHSREA